MRPKSIAILVLLVAGAAGLCWHEIWSNSKTSESRDHKIAALAPPKPKMEARPAPSARDVAELRASLDKVAGASLQEVYDLLSGRSRSQIAALARQLEDASFGGRNGAKIDLFFRAWAQLSPSDALQTALSFRQGGWARTRALEAIFDGTSPSGSGALVKSISELPSSALSEALRTDILERGISNWSRADPQAAANFLETSSASMISQFVWNEVLDNWAAQDPSSALSWVQQLHDPSRASDAMQGLISGWWQKDPQAAADYSAAHADTLAGQRAASIVANRMADEDPGKAVKWAAELPDPAAREMSELTATLGWAANDPGAAGAWASTLPLSEQEAVVGGIATAWGRKDPQAAAEWISGLEGSARDAATVSFSATVAQNDPEAALGWALTISNSSLRDATARQIASGWLARDPASARDWIQRSDLPSTDKAELRKATPPTP